MKNRKKLKYLLVLVLLIISISFSVHIKEFNNKESTIKKKWDISLNDEDNVIATLNEDGTLVISGNGKMQQVLNWEECRSDIVSIEVQNGISNIGKNAFVNCENLEDVKIAESVTEIEDNAFANCRKLDTVIIPESLTQIGEKVFENCDNLKQINIADEKDNSNVYTDEYIEYLQLSKEEKKK